MIVDALSVDSELRADLAIVGAGPAGIVTALEIAEAGFDVVLVESGRGAHDPRSQALGDAETLDGDLHAPMSMATRRGIGGASAIWGGRCVPFDPVDFDRRPWVTGHEWPVSYEELVPHFQRACDWFVCGEAVFDATRTKAPPTVDRPGIAERRRTILRARAVVTADRLRPPLPRPPPRRRTGPPRHRRDVHPGRSATGRSRRRPARLPDARGEGADDPSEAVRGRRRRAREHEAPARVTGPGRPSDRRPLGSSRSLVHGPRGGRGGQRALHRVATGDDSRVRA